MFRVVLAAVGFKLFLTAAFLLDRGCLFLLFGGEKGLEPGDFLLLSRWPFRLCVFNRLFQRLGGLLVLLGNQLFLFDQSTLRVVCLTLGVVDFLL